MFVPGYLLDGDEWVEHRSCNKSIMHLNAKMTVIVSKSDFTGLTPENISSMLDNTEAEQQQLIKKFKTAKAKLFDNEAELIALRAYKEFIEAEKRLTKFSTHNQKIQVRKGRSRTWQMSNRIYCWRENTFTQTGGDVSATCQLLISHPFFFNWISWTDDVVLIEYKERLKNKEEAVEWFEKHLEEFSHLFTEESPPVPEILKSLFTLQGNSIPGVRFDDGIIDKCLMGSNIRRYGLPL